MIENPSIGRLALQKLRIACAALKSPELAQRITEAELAAIRESVLLIVQALDNLSDSAEWTKNRINRKV